MAAPTFVGAGAGAVFTTAGGGTVNGPTVQVGDIILLHVLIDGSGAVTIGSSSGLEGLSGISGLSSFTSGFVGGSSEAFHYLYIGRATATSVSIDIGSNGPDQYARLYAFRGVNAGSTGPDVLEGAASESGTSSTVFDVDVTTTGADRLVVNVVAVNDDNALSAFSSMSGGTWAEAVSEFASATGTDGCIQLQTATLPAATTIGGGQLAMAAADAWGVIGFALKPAGPSGVTLAASLGMSLGVSPALKVEKPLAAQLAGSLSVAAALKDEKLLAAQIAAAMTAGGALDVERTLAATLDSALTLTSALLDEKLLAAQLDSVSAFAAALRDEKPLAAQLAFASALAGDLAVTQQAVLAAILSSASLMSGDLRDGKPLAAQLDALSDVSASLLRVQGLAAQLAAATDASGSLRVEHLLAAELAETFNVAARLTSGAFLGAVGRRMLFGLGR